MRADNLKYRIPVEKDLERWNEWSASETFEEFQYDQEAENILVAACIQRPTWANVIISEVDATELFFLPNIVAFCSIAWLLQSDYPYAETSLEHVMENHRKEICRYAEDVYNESIHIKDIEAILHQDHLMRWATMTFFDNEISAAIKIVKFHAVARLTFHECVQVANSAIGGFFDFDDVQHRLRRVTNGITNAIGTRSDITAAESADDFLERFLDRQPISSYTPALVDGLVSFERGKYYVIAGRPGTGKTALLNQLARRIAAMPNREAGEQERYVDRVRVEKYTPNMKVLVLQLEDTDQTFTMRALAEMAQVPMDVLRRSRVGARSECPRCGGRGFYLGADAQQVTCPCREEYQSEIDQKVMEATERYRKLDIRIVTDKCTPEQLREKIYAQYALAPYDVLIVDHLQNVNIGRHTKMEAVELANQYIVEAAGDVDLHPDGLIAIAASQFNRDQATGRGAYEYTPQLANLRQTGEIEQQVTGALGIGYSVDDEGRMTPERKLHVLKNRDGDLYVPPQKYYFAGQYMQFIKDG